MVSTNDDPKNKLTEKEIIGSKIDNSQNGFRILNECERIIRVVSTAFTAIAVMAFICTVITTCVDIIGGSFFHYSIPGFTEVLGITQLISMSFAMGMTFFAGHHIKVEIILNLFPLRLQALVNTVTNLLGFILFVIIIWQLIALGMDYQESAEILDGTPVLVYPFVYATAVAFIPVCLGLFFDLIKSFYGVINKSEEPQFYKS